ncbi:hypothetical protein IIA15_04350 [candidate division TA06 bacterium]|nr:hypothetical protein [candidate division TA06 bacterium]
MPSGFAKDFQPPPSPSRATKDKLRLREGFSTPSFTLAGYEGQAPNTRRTFSLTFDISDIELGSTDIPHSRL